jgi:hypothetical protein
LEHLAFTENEYGERTNTFNRATKENDTYIITKITCAGMPDQCYKYVTWDNFTEGASFKGKLQMSHVDGGIILKDIDFTIKK